MQNDENPEIVKHNIQKINQGMRESEEVQENWSLRQENNKFKENEITNRRSGFHNR